MAFTLSDTLQALYKQLGQLNVSIATGGSATTVIDTKQIGLHRDNSWKDGAVFIIRDAAGASASPEGKFERVSAYVNSTGTFTFATLTDAIASGDTFGFVSSYYPIYQMIQSVNDGLRSLGDMEFNDTTTLDTIDGDTEYSAAIAWKRTRPPKFWIQGRTGDAADNQWQEVTDYQWEPAIAGSAGRLILNFYPIGSRDVKVRYKDKHGVVNAYNDPIDERITPKLVVAAAMVEALQWQNSRVQGADSYLLQLLNKSLQDLENAKMEVPIERTKRSRQMFVTGSSERYYDPNSGSYRV